MIGCGCTVCRSLDYRDKRLRSSIVIEIDGKSLVIDTGPDFRAQALAHRLTRLDAVLVTHSHKDHMAGMDDCRQFYFDRGSRDIPVYGSPATIVRVKQEFDYAFAENKYPGVPGFEVHEVGDSDFEVEGIRVTPVHVLHHRMPVLGFRIGGFSYVTDASHIAPEELDKLRGSDVLVLNALTRKKHISHFNLEEAISVAQEVSAEKTYFTHCSHRLGSHQDVTKELPEGIQLAFDGLQITV